MPRFSIIVPAYNRANTISRTLDSLYAQTSTDFEVIVVDDGSTDNTKEIVSVYVQQKGLNYFYQPNSGVSAARNCGAMHAAGEYLLFLDSDDTVTSTWIKNYEEKILEQGADLLYCGITRIRNGSVIGQTDPANPFNNGVAYGNFIPGSFCLKRVFFESVGGYDTILSYSENTELSFRLKQKGPKETFIAAYNLEYHVSDDGLSRNWVNRKNAMLHILQKHRITLANDKQTMYRFLSVSGVAAVHTRDWTVARKSFRKACLIRPYSLLCHLRYGASFFPFIASKIWKQ
jgi:glycosyltransferase involved in cell wall biosynthesis